MYTSKALLETDKLLSKELYNLYRTEKWANAQVTKEGNIHYM